jgi:hypothetical protein
VLVDVDSVIIKSTCKSGKATSLPNGTHVCQAAAPGSKDPYRTDGEIITIGSCKENKNNELFSVYEFGAIPHNEDLTLASTNPLISGSKYTVFCAKPEAGGFVVTAPTDIVTAGFSLLPTTKYLHDEGITITVAATGVGSASGQQRVTCGVALPTTTLVGVQSTGNNNEADPLHVESLTGVVGVSVSKLVGEAEATDFAFEGLVQNTTYQIMCVRHPTWKTTVSGNDFTNAGKNTSFVETTLIPCRGGTFNQQARGTLCDQEKADGGVSGDTCATYGGLHRRFHPNDCLVCTSGRYTPGSEQNFRCIKCISGRFLADNGTNHTLHNAYASGTNMAEETCTACPAGQYQEFEGQGHCVQCLPGKFMPPEKSGARVECECEDCFKGSVQAQPGQTACTDCQPNVTSTGFVLSFYQANVGQTKCAQCGDDEPIAVNDAKEEQPPYTGCMAALSDGPPAPFEDIDRKYDSDTGGITFSWKERAPGNIPVNGYYIEWSEDSSFSGLKDTYRTTVPAGTTTVTVPGFPVVPKANAQGLFIVADLSPATTTVANHSGIVLRDPHEYVTYFRVTAFKIELGVVITGPSPSPITQAWTTTEACGGLKYLQTFVPIKDDHPLNKEHPKAQKKPITEWECTICPPGGDCKANAPSGVWEVGIRAMYGYWRVKGTVEFAACPFPMACLGEPNPALAGKHLVAADPNEKSAPKWADNTDLATLALNETCNYWKGHEIDGNCYAQGVGGQPCRLCSSCQVGYILKPDKQCSKCPPRGSTYALLGVMFLLMIVVVVAMVGAAVKSAGKEGLSDAIKKIFLNWMSVSALAANFPLRWPPQLMQLFSVQAVVGNMAEVASPACEFSSTDKAWDFYKSLVFYAIFPVVIPMFFALGWLILACAKRKRLNDLWKSDKFTVKDHVVLTVVVVLFLMYPTICNKTISLFACRAVGASVYLDADLQEECFVGRHLVVVVLLGCGQIIAWVFGLPFIGCYMMWKNKKILDDPHIGFRFGLLHHGYRHERYWWEAIVCIRKVAFIFVGILGRMAPVEIQTHLALFILFIALVLHLYFVPFESVGNSNGVLHILESAALCSGWLTMWGGLLMFQIEGEIGPTENEKGWKIAIIQITVIAINVAMGVYLVFNLVREYAIEHKMEEKLCGRCKGKIDRDARDLDGLPNINVKDMRAVFELVDTDHGGTIDCDELYVLLRMRGMNITKLRVKSMIRAYSTDGDDELDFQEFCTLMSGASSGDAEALTRHMVKKMSQVEEGRVDGELDGVVVDNPLASNARDSTTGDELVATNLSDEIQRLKALLVENDIVDPGPAHLLPATPDTTALLDEEVITFTVVDPMKPGMKAKLKYGPSKQKEFEFVIPDGATPGTVLKVPVPASETITFTVTAPMTAGMKAKLKYGPNKDKEFEFTIPDDAYEGKVLEIAAPDVRTAEI